MAEVKERGFPRWAGESQKGDALWTAATSMGSFEETDSPPWQGRVSVIRRGRCPDPGHPSAKAERGAEPGKKAQLEAWDLAGDLDFRVQREQLRIEPCNLTNSQWAGVRDVAQTWTRAKVNQQDRAGAPRARWLPREVDPRWPRTSVRLQPEKLPL